MESLNIHRRGLLAGGGALVISLFAAQRPASADTAAEPLAGVPDRPALDPSQLSTYISVNEDGGAIAYFGKMDGGQGTDIGIAQMVAEELDLDVERVTIVMGDTGTTIDQGGASGSTGIALGGKALRHAAAAARGVLVDIAAERLGVPAEQLVVNNGVVSIKSDPQKSVSYVDLIGGRYFDVALEWNGKIGNALDVSGKAQPKTFDQYRVVGQSVRRRDVAPKVLGEITYVVDVKVPGMLHGRMIRPPVAGAVPVSVDESSVADIPGVQVVRQKDFIGLVAPKEWDAIRAAQQLKVAWSDVTPPFPGNASIYDHIRNAPELKRGGDKDKGDVDAAFANPAQLIEATYEWPFQSHASLGPACCVADVRPDSATVWTGSQKPHASRDGVAAFLGLPRDKVRAIWTIGPGSYGRNDAGDAVMDAVMLSKLTGKPVRLQGMRYEGHGWDPKAPASVHTARAAIDADGNVVGYEYQSKGFSRIDVAVSESDPRQTLAGQLIGMALKPTQEFGTPGEAYTFAAKRQGWATVAPLLDRASPLRSSHMRDPAGPQISFGSESFIDELAVATKTDPVAFRLRYLTNPRDRTVIQAAADKAQWQPRQGPRSNDGDVAVGRGIAFASRGGTRAAVIADIEVDRKTGRIWARRFTVAHDSGQIINPDLLRLTIEGNVMQGLSRALHEEVTFDDKNVTSIDWETYPILDITDAPESVDVVLINHPEVPPTGAGENSIRPIAAAVANAVFDAIGVRMRQAPLTPERVKAQMV